VSAAAAYCHYKCMLRYRNSVYNQATEKQKKHLIDINYEVAIDTVFSKTWTAELYVETCIVLAVPACEGIEATGCAAV